MIKTYRIIQDKCKMGFMMGEVNREQSKKTDIYTC